MYTKVFEPVTSYTLDLKPQEKSIFKKFTSIKEHSPLVKHSADNYSWLANEWIRQNG